MFVHAEMKAFLGARIAAVSTRGSGKPGKLDLDENARVRAGELPRWADRAGTGQVGAWMRIGGLWDTGAQIGCCVGRMSTSLMFTLQGRLTM